VITIITGSPGAGKTLNTLPLVEQECEGRKIHYVGIRNLTLSGWEEISYDDARNWRDYPAGSVFVIDEADLFAANDPIARRTTPDYVRELARHRHRGMDFYLVTQKPTMVHYELRPHVGRHLHFERQFGRESSRRLEWQRCVDDPTDYHVRKEAITQRVLFPKKYYEAYHSAEVHTHKPRIPKKLYFIVALFVVAGLLLTTLLRSIQDKSNPEYSEESGSGLSEAYAMTAGERRAGKQAATVTAEEFGNRMLPRIQDIPLSAPMYDGVTDVKTFPRPQCIYSHRTAECRCFTQQATVMHVSYDMCRDIVSNGWFNPYRDEEGDGRARTDRRALAAPSSPPQGDREIPKIVMIGSQGGISPVRSGGASLIQPRGTYSESLRATRNR
jgi:zona occludens toxin